MKRKLSFAILFAWMATSVAAAGQHLSVAHTFICNGTASERIGACPGGAEPNSLIVGSDGNLYGTAGASSEGEGVAGNGGTVFSVTPAGKFTVLHTFVPVTNGTSNFSPGMGTGPLA